MVRYLIIVEGRVQGVGFRYFTQRIAETCHLTGLVKNLKNGSVSISVQGDYKNIDLFLALLLKGNNVIRINNHSLKLATVIGNESKFKIIY